MTCNQIFSHHKGSAYKRPFVSRDKANMSATYGSLAKPLAKVIKRGNVKFLIGMKWQSLKCRVSKSIECFNGSRRYWEALQIQEILLTIKEEQMSSNEQSENSISGSFFWERKFLNMQKQGNGKKVEFKFVFTFILVLENLFRGKLKEGFNRMNVQPTRFSY